MNKHQDIEVALAEHPGDMLQVFANLIATLSVPGINHITRAARLRISLLDLNLNFSTLASQAKVVHSPGLVKAHSHVASRIHL